MRPIDADRLLKMMSHWKPYMDMDDVREAIKKFPTLTPQNEALTQASLDKMDYDKVWIDYEDGCGEWALVCNGYIYSIDALEGAGLDFADYMRGDKLEPHGCYKLYRRPPGRQEGHD